MELLGKLIWGLVFGIGAITMLVFIVMIYFYPPYRLILCLFRSDESVWQFLCWLILTIIVWFN